MKLIEQIKAYVPQGDIQTEHRKIFLRYIEALGDEVLFRSSSVAHMTSSAVILNEARNKMLMIHHNIYNTWTWTGGHADGEEDLAYIALKEAQEETGLKSLKFLTNQIMRLDPLPVYGHYKHGHYVGTHLHLNVSYVMVADELEKTVVKPDENSDIQWVGIDELGKYSDEPDFVLLYLDIIHRSVHL